jgi:2-iminobutanoate/2-iminopropanoate deaminase
VNVLITRREDVAEMSRIYRTYLSAGRHPVRTTYIVAALPDPDFLVEIDWHAFFE